MVEKLWQKYNFPPPKSEASKGKLSLVDNEIYSGIELPELPLFVRLDGWRFHRIAKELKLKAPYDEFFVRCLVKASRTIFSLFDPKLCYIFSDEINFLFLKRPGFSRVEKIDSIFAGIVSSAFTQVMGTSSLPLAFDCRCIPLFRAQILKYLTWRQAEALRNCHNSWAYHLLAMKGLKPRAIAKRLSGLNIPRLRKLLEGEGLLEKIAGWQMRGVLLYKESYEKEGWDPIKKEKVMVTRFRVREEWDPPRFNSKEGKEFLRELLR